ncbi:MAG TPA: permease prefix domain 1-containing protein [Acidimicrobiia bacterium]|nr:permease prefix domain 1-containing protein [Acidimicrobiia bacterium]
MSELTDRYVGATLRTIPEKQRDDIEAELRASIADAIEARYTEDDNPDDVEREVLTELGDPDRLAADYAGRPSYLIGPEHFFTYRRLLAVLLVTVVPIVAAVVAMAQVLSGSDIGSVFASAMGTAITVAVHIGFWTTVVFYFIERSDDTELPETWSLDSLPPTTDRGEIKLGEMIASVVFLVLAIAGLSLTGTLSPFTAADGSAVPIFDPDLWSFWVPYFVAVLGLEIVFEVVKFRVRRWTFPLAWVNLALNAFFAIPAIYLLMSDRVFNEAFFEELGWGSAPNESDLLVRIIAVSIAVVCTWDVFDGFRKAWRGRH